MEERGEWNLDVHVIFQNHLSRQKGVDVNQLTNGITLNHLNLIQLIYSNQKIIYLSA
jgi:hypothetical protein